MPTQRSSHPHAGDVTLVLQDASDYVRWCNRVTDQLIIQDLAYLLRDDQTALPDAKIDNLRIALLQVQQRSGFDGPIDSLLPRSLEDVASEVRSASRNDTNQNKAASAALRKTPWHAEIKRRLDADDRLLAAVLRSYCSPSIASLMMYETSGMAMWKTLGALFASSQFGSCLDDITMRPNESVISLAGRLCDQDRLRERGSGARQSEESKVRDLLVQISAHKPNEAQAWLRMPFGEGRKTSFVDVVAGLMSAEAMEARRKRRNKNPNTG